MSLRCHLGILLAGLLVLAGCQRPDADEYRILTEESAEDSADSSLPTDREKPKRTEPPRSRPAEEPLLARGEGGDSKSQPLELPGEERLDRPATAPAAAAAAPPGVPLPEPLAAVLPPERSARSAAERKAEAEVARMRAELLGEPLPEETRTGGPREIRLLVPHKDFSPEGAEGALRVTFDDLDLLKTLNMEPVPVNVMDYLPDWLRDLDGKRIILRGWMFPSGRQEGISRFMFVRDNGICCFGRTPKVYDKLGVTMRQGVTTSYIQGRPFDVVATFSIDADIDGDEVFWLYHLDDAIVIDHK